MISLDYFDILKKPLVTEKTMLNAQHNTVVFVVHKDATKKLVAEAISKIYGVKVKKINILTSPHKPKQKKGKTKPYKKAYVVLNKGESLDNIITTA
ncbi:MAG: 50S ribosomal protein L23 [Alphaproteobacteria bacterium]|nr:50S ribosomal protein L23 [Alphaproteobacteria bacterium]MBL0718167.1 50S ribosomal protein L23 [Alphaproteobacteria bacterium]